MSRTHNIHRATSAVAVLLVAIVASGQDPSPTLEASESLVEPSAVPADRRWLD